MLTRQGISCLCTDKGTLRLATVWLWLQRLLSFQCCYWVYTCLPVSWPQASTLKNLLELPADPSSWPVNWRTSQWALVKPAPDVFSTDRIPQRKPAAFSAHAFPLSEMSNYRRLPLWEHGIVGDVCVKKASMFERRILRGHPNGWLPHSPLAVLSAFRV